MNKRKGACLFHPEGGSQHILGDDIKTFKNPNATFAQRGLAGVSILGTVAPPLKGAKGVKVAEELIDASKVFTADQAALIDLAKAAKRTGVSSEDAETLLKWADEYNVPGRGPEVHPNRPFGKNEHIHIGPVDHIFINQ